MKNIGEILKITVEKGLAEIPVVGKFLEALAEIFWPDEEKDIWEEIKDQVDEEIHTKIDDHTFAKMKKDLRAFKSHIAEFRQAIEDGTEKSVLESHLVEVFGSFDDLQAQLEDPELEDRELAGRSLPLYAPAVTMYLTVLRDAILLATSRNWEESIVRHYQRKFEQVPDLVAYFERVFHAANALHRAKLGYETPKAFAYHRFLTRNVMDQVHFWPYFDPTTDQDSIPGVTSEVFYKVFGEVSDKQPLTYPPVPNQYPSAIAIASREGNHRIDEVYLAYGTARHHFLPIGVSGRKPDTPPVYDPPAGYVGAVQIDNPIVALEGSTDNRKHSAVVRFKNGDTVEVPASWGWFLGDTRPGTQSIGPFPGQVVSSIRQTGLSGYGSIGGVLPGFRYEDSFPDPAQPREIAFHEWDQRELDNSTTTLDHAKANAKAKGVRLVAAEEVWVAWKRSGYNQDSFGMLSNGYFAVPLQQDADNLKAGCNIQTPERAGGNEGYFSTQEKQIGFAGEAGISTQAAQRICDEEGWELATMWDLQWAVEQRGFAIEEIGLVFNEIIAKPTDFVGSWQNKDQVAGFYYAYG